MSHTKRMLMAAALPQTRRRLLEIFGSGLLLMAVAMQLPASAHAQHAVSAAQSAPTEPGTRLLKAQQLPSSLSAEGVVEATQQATLAAQVSGRVIDVRIDAGSRVKAGQMLLQIDARETTAALGAARAALDQARASVERSRNLRQQDFISQAALDQAEASYAAAVSAASQASTTASHAQIRAPFDGIVRQRHVALGDMAQPGRPLLEIYQPQELRVLTSLPQAHLASLQQQGNSLQARIELPGQAQWLEASHIEVLPGLNAQTHGVSLRVYLPAQATPGLTPGLFARVHFLQLQADTPAMLTVPVSAILRRNELTVVYVMDAQGQPQLRQVRLGRPQANGEIEIRAGLTAGETIALQALAASTRRKP